MDDQKSEMISKKYTDFDQLHMKIAYTSKTFVGHIDSQINSAVGRIDARLNVCIDL